MKGIKQLRYSAGIRTVREAAEKLNISRSHLYKIEEGLSVPGIKLAMKMAKLYGCSLQEVLRQKGR